MSALRSVPMPLDVARAALLDVLVARQDDLQIEEDYANAPYVCPGCYAIDGEVCAAYCPDAAIERDREDDRDARLNAAEDDYGDLSEEGWP